MTLKVEITELDRIYTNEEFEALGQHYIINDSERVSNFLREHPFLITLLQEAYPKIVIWFRDAKIYLELSTDPEIADEMRLLVLISPTCEPSEAFDKFKQFKQSWWLEAAPQTKGKLYIMLEYR